MAVSDKELLEDIKNTEIEANAYNQIAEGYRILYYLPESTRAYQAKSAEFKELERECRAFLEQLLDIKSRRGL